MKFEKSLSSSWAKRNQSFFLVTLILLSSILLNHQLLGKPDLRNIIIISVDTLRADHLSCYGYPLQTSPELDKFAADSILYRNFYSLTALTGPAFTTMLTALPPHKHGAKRNGLSIYRKIRTLPEILDRFGYHSAAFISNWPLRKKLSGLHHGFDEYFEVFTKKRWLGVKDPEGRAPDVTREAVAWLEENYKKKPRILMWVHYSEPHAPYINHKGFNFDYSSVPESAYPPGTHMKRIKKYDSEIAFTDHHIGRFIQRLKELGVYEDSLIIFNADHGESFGEHNYFKHGKYLYNSTVQVPLIVKLPGDRFKNTRRDENACMLDIAPTVLSVLNLPILPHMDGVPLIKNGQDDYRPDPDRAIVLEAYRSAVRGRRSQGKFHMKVKPIRYAVIRGPFKLIYNPKPKTYEAYRIPADPFETLSVYNATQTLPMLDRMQTMVLESFDRIGLYIRLNRKKRLETSALSKEDLDKLKSLGYID